MTNPLVALNQIGQSVWFDNIDRSMLDQNGALVQRIHADDLRGITSNPAIFEKAIKSSTLYDEQLNDLKQQTSNISAREAFFKLAISDIAKACDLLYPVYQKTKGVDGMVSLEVSPDLAHKTKETIDEAQDLWARLNRPNAMIKIPATLEALPAITYLVAQGININVTLLFSVERYVAVAEAYLNGLKQRVDQGLPIDHVASVASFFVSRLDTVLDPLVMEKQLPHLQGKVAIANAKIAYQEYLSMLESEQFQSLQEKEAKPQRLLWASTGVKNPGYSDVLYVEHLIGHDTVNTMPPSTYDAFKDHGKVRISILDEAIEAKKMLDYILPEAGIDLSKITTQLEIEGLAQFEEAFTNLLAEIEAKL